MRNIDKIFAVVAVFNESLFASEVPYGLEKDVGAYVLPLLFASEQRIKQAACPQSRVLLSPCQGE